MKSILTALQAGRLIEISETEKEKALRYMASIIEAIPEVSARVDIAQGVLEREKTANTGMGHGWACPHIRVDGDGELFSVIGWSPSGIDYGAPDGKKVHLLVMYYIPENQKNSYLKELSSLAKAIQKGQGIENIEKASTINDVRNELLNWVSSTTDCAMPQTKVRMIKLEVKQSQSEDIKNIILKGIENIIPFYLVSYDNSKAIALAQDLDLVHAIESSNISNISENHDLQAPGYKIFIRSKTLYKPNRAIYDCIAVKQK
jgi:mannitol/fructose-specific phosphotransferase system IIA component (Ntr-type)